MSDRAPRRAALEAALEQRILVLDGAWGTMIQNLRLDEAAFRGARFAAHGHDLQGNNDILNLTQSAAIQGIAEAYLEAGADILTTNTFNANRISQADYGCESAVGDINREGARLARQAADAWTRRTPARPRFVAGALGPTNKTATISPDVNDPGFRNVSFDELAAVYAEATRALVAGGVDIVLIETIFDTLNAKAALFAVEAVFDELGEALPIMISGTITDLSGRTLTGQTPAAFWYSLRHARPITVGLNCSLGAAEMRPHLAELSRVAEVPVCAYPNAGLPNAFGGYDQTPEEMAAHLREWAAAGLVNVVGGCCGSTPAHIAAIAKAVDGLAPRTPPRPPRRLRLSGLEAVEVAP